MRSVSLARADRGASCASTFTSSKRRKGRKVFQLQSLRIGAFGFEHPLKDRSYGVHVGDLCRFRKGAVRILRAATEMQPKKAAAAGVGAMLVAGRRHEKVLSRIHAVFLLVVADEEGSLRHDHEFVINKIAREVPPTALGGEKFPEENGFDGFFEIKSDHLTFCYHKIRKCTCRISPNNL